jgi:hypothetical protein
MPRTSTLLAATLLAMLLMLSACTRVVTVRTPVDEMPPGSLTGTGNGDAWWSIVFRMHWDPEQTPDWYLDALVADQICAPALVDFGAQISLWRFHRRAADDQSGHRLSLMVYTDSLTADILFTQIRAAPLLQWLELDGRIDSVSMTQVERPELPPIARTSDAAWPPEIQSSWPWFIMGVSQSWLILIRQVSAEQPLEDPSPAALLDYYRSVDDQVTALWREYGQHVYLHHLNALFGYQPLIIRETNLKRF